MRIFNLPVYRIDSSVVFPFAFFNMAIARLIAHVALKMDLSVPFGGGKPAAAAVRGEFGAAVHLRLWVRILLRGSGIYLMGFGIRLRGLGICIRGLGICISGLGMFKGVGNLFEWIGVNLGY